MKCVNLRIWYFLCSVVNKIRVYEQIIAFCFYWGQQCLEKPSDQLALVPATKVNSNLLIGPALFQTGISHQLNAKLLRHLVQTVMLHKWWILLILAVHRLFLCHYHDISIVIVVNSLSSWLMWDGFQTLTLWLVILLSIIKLKEEKTKKTLHFMTKYHQK